MLMIAFMAIYQDERGRFIL